jgi:hypothetical protein
MVCQLANLEGEQGGYKVSEKQDVKEVRDGDSRTKADNRTRDEKWGASS